MSLLTMTFTITFPRECLGTEIARKSFLSIDDVLDIHDDMRVGCYVVRRRSRT